MQEAAVLFENDYERNQAYIQEFYRCIWSKSIQTMYLLAIFLFLMTAGILFSKIRGVPLFLTGIGFLIALMQALRYDRIMPYYLMKREYRQRQYLYGEYGRIHFQFGEKEIKFFDQSSGTRVYYQIKDIEKVQESAHLILLGMPGNMWVIIDKNGFTMGNPNDFWDYLHACCPQAEWLNRR